MRAIRTAVVLSSLLITAGAMAGGSDSKTTGKGTSAKTPAAGSASGSAAAATGSAAAPAPDTNGTSGSAASAPSNVDLSSVPPEDMPTPVRQRRLEQKTQALKERAWQLKARMQMLKEQMLGGGVGAQAVITHANDMGSAFRLISISYSLDGTKVFVRTDDTGDNLYKAKSFDIFSGPISPGNHNIAALATYRGHGYGVFEYLSKFTFTARGSNAFTAGEGKIAKVECKGYEKGGAATPMEKRPAIDCKVVQVAPEKPAETPTQTTPGSTPMPAPAATTPTQGQ